MIPLSIGEQYIEPDVVYMMDDTDYAEHLLLNALEDDSEMKQPTSAHTLSTLCSGTVATASMMSEEDMDDLSFLDDDAMGIVNTAEQQQYYHHQQYQPHYTPAMYDDQKSQAKPTVTATATTPTEIPVEATPSKTKPATTSSPKKKGATSVTTATKDESQEESTETKKNGGPVRVGVPSKFDILCGQSRICASHTGNRRFQVVLDIYAPKYDGATSKQEKMMITKEIVSCIHQAGGRFLKYTDGQWEEISNVTARDKVSHALRTKVASWKRQQQEQEKTASSSGNNRRSSTGSSKPSHRKGGGVGGIRKSRRTSDSSILSSASDIVATSFDGNDSASANVMTELIKAQREIFATLTSPAEQEEDETETHPLKK
jgi:hypothetical protein